MKNKPRTLKEHGVLWTYIPNRAYTATINQIPVTIRRLGNAARHGFKWRLFLANNVAPPGHQFFRSAIKARSRGIELAMEMSQGRNWVEPFGI